MTATPLAPTPQGRPCLAERVRGLHGLIDELQTLTVTAADAVCLAEVDRARTRLDGLRLRLIAAADAGGVAAGAGLATTADWVARRTRATRQDSASASTLAVSLAGTGDHAPLVGTRSALEDGALSAAHAKVIADGLRRLPADVSPDGRAACEARLVDLAGRYDPTQLRRVARRILAEIEPDPTVVDAHENTQLVEEEDSAYDSARLTLHDNGDGTCSGHFTLPTLQSDILRKIIDAITAPRRTNGHDKRRQQPGEPPNPLVRDHTDPAHARGLAFAQLLEHLPTDHLHGTATTQVTVLMDIDTLRGHLKAAGLDTDRPISAGEARRMACTSRLVPAVFGRTLSGTSRILDLGRTSRLFTDAQRTAITALHTHCATHGCSRPIAWCELHHKTPWSTGGHTNLHDAVPLCGWHHRRIHDHRYTHDWHTDDTVTMRLRR